MDMAEIERLAPLDDAPVVAFDYAAAVAALDTVSATTTSVGELGAGIDTARHEATMNWEGVYRHEFERAHWLLDRQFFAVVDTLHSAKRAILAAIDDANEQQRAYNLAHEQTSTNTQTGHG
jgi:hypothetical protein